MIIKPIKTKSRLSRINIVFKSGSKVEFGTRFKFGTAHMLEHMMFKGTEKRSSIDISREYAEIGAMVNAFTSHNEICFEMTVMTEYLERALDIFSDMILNATLPEEEFEKERLVVMQEEESHADDINSFFADYEFETMIDGYLSKTVIGYKESIESITLEELRSFKNRFLDISMATICIASSMSKKDAKNTIQKYFGKASGRVKSGPKLEKNVFKEPKEFFIERSDISHNYVDIIYPAFERGNDKSMPLAIAASILGGGMDSRLFEIVREKHGLVYSIHANRIELSELGFFNISFSCSKDNVEKVMTLIDKAIEDVMDNGFTETELNNAKISSKMFLCEVDENESYVVSNKMKSEIYGYKTYKEKFEILENTSLDDVNKVSEEVLGQDRFVFVFGKTEEEEDYAEPL